MKETLLEFQSAAVKIAAHHLTRRGGVVIGDVVGLGKTMMAVALCRLLQDEEYTSALIICPANLVKMWEGYVERFGLIARVVSLGSVQTTLPQLRPYRVVLVDESHNLRNREGARYRVIREYVEQSQSRCILLSATPYNKAYEDLAAQLRLFVPEHADLGIRPERLLRQIGEAEFVRRHQAPVRSLAAFEHSPFADDWRELMRLYLVRRTRGFIEENYAELDDETGRRYLRFPDGRRHFFPKRIPLTVRIPASVPDVPDPYARLFSADIVDSIGKLKLPRYGLARYIRNSELPGLTDSERATAGRLSRAGTRLMGFTRTNLFKRLESGGPAFLQSLYRHALRNFILLNALVEGLPVPVGAQDARLLDVDTADDDSDDLLDLSAEAGLDSDGMRGRARELYGQFAGPLHSKFRWLPANLFNRRLHTDLLQDAELILSILRAVGPWNPEEDTKLRALRKLVFETHPDTKLLIFTQFADTAAYLQQQLWSMAPERDRAEIAALSGRTADPTDAVWRFSPRSNDRESYAETNPLRVLISTDVLSEGQNLQDAHVVVNFDLPWAIIRLIQRAGRVDRIGQESPQIYCYSFLPATGVEQLLQLRARVRARLASNAAVLGTDEQFFEDDVDSVPLVDLYNERAGILDEEADSEVDLASQAYQIWKNAIDRDPSLAASVPALPDVAYATKRGRNSSVEPNGALVYVRTGDGADALTYIGADGEIFSQSQATILNIAACGPDEPALARQDNHHDLVSLAIRQVVSSDTFVGGQLGRSSGPRYKIYHRLRRFSEQVQGTLFDTPELRRSIDDIYRYPLQQTAVDVIGRQLRNGISDTELVDVVAVLREEGRLSLTQADSEDHPPQLICSMGLA